MINVKVYREEVAKFHVTEPRGKQGHCNRGTH
jgi:hypothetical protein